MLILLGLVLYHTIATVTVAININKSFKIVKIASIYRRKTRIFTDNGTKMDYVFVSKKMPLDKLLPGTIPLSPIQRQNKDTKKTIFQKSYKNPGRSSIYFTRLWICGTRENNPGIYGTGTNKKDRTHLGKKSSNWNAGKIKFLPNE